MDTHSGFLEKDLLALIASGSEEAFRELFNTYRGKLYGYIYKMTESRETAEDTVHDVFLKIWEGRENLSHIQNFNAYLHRMAHNQAYSGFRRMAKETLVLAEIRAEQSGMEAARSGIPGAIAPEAEERIKHEEVRTLIRSLVERLSPQQRLVYLLSQEEGLKHHAIAEKMGLSIYTVKNHLAAAMRFLREEIGKTYGPHAIAIYMIFNLY